MRELLAEEMRFVSGGLINQPPGGTTDLPGYNVGGGGGGGIPNDGYYRPPSGDPGGGGSGGGTAPGAGGGLSATQLAGLARIKSELGIDLTVYAQMSPSLAQSISLATATYDWHFDFSANGSSCAYSATSTVQGTIHIGSAYQGNELAIVQQLSHEFAHIDHRVWDDPHKVDSQTYVNHYLTAEGYSTLANERVEHEILSASNGAIDINIASANPAITRPIYDAQYNRSVANPYSRDDAAQQIGQAYGQYERAGDGRSYSEIFLENYHLGGGTR